LTSLAKLIGSHLVITPLLVPSSQGWNSNRIVHFMNTISQSDNKLDGWYCLHHPRSLDARFWWLAEPVPEESWYETNLAYLLPSTPNYQHPFKAHSCDKAPRCTMMLRDTNSIWMRKTSNCNYTLYYSHTRAWFQSQCDRTQACIDSGKLMDLK